MGSAPINTTKPAEQWPQISLAVHHFLLQMTRLRRLLLRNAVQARNPGHPSNYQVRSPATTTMNASTVLKSVVINFDLVLSLVVSSKEKLLIAYSSLSKGRGQEVWECVGCKKSVALRAWEKVRFDVKHGFNAVALLYQGRRPLTNGQSRTSRADLYVRQSYTRAVDNHPPCVSSRNVKGLCAFEAIRLLTLHQISRRYRSWRGYEV